MKRDGEEERKEGRKEGENQFDRVKNEEVLQRDKKEKNPTLNKIKEC